MKAILTISIFIIALFASCSSGPAESPDGKYGNAVTMDNLVPFSELGPKRGQYIKHEIVLMGTIEEIDNLAGEWFNLKTPDGGIKCTIEDFGLPQSLVGKQVYAQGILEMILASSEKGRPIGGEYTTAVDPMGSSYDDELRLRINGVEVVNAGTE